MLTQVEVRPETLEALKTLLLAPNEGVLAVKFVLLTQQTLTAGESAAKIDAAPSVAILGDLDEIKSQLSKWLDEAITAYQAKKGI